MARNRTDWPRVKREYVADRTLTYRQLAEKHNVSFRAVAYHGRRENWPVERVNYCANVDNLLVAKASKQSAVTIQELNEAHLKRSGQLRVLLEHRLLARGPDGKVLPRESLTINDIAKAVVAFGELYRLDRLALGADANGSIHAAQSVEYERLRAMSDAELEEELAKVRALSTMVQ